MYAWIAESEDVAFLREKAAEAEDALTNPFTSRWGREAAEYRLLDIKQRLAQLGAA